MSKYTERDLRKLTRDALYGRGKSACHCTGKHKIDKRRYSILIGDRGVSLIADGTDFCPATGTYRDVSISVAI